MTRSATLAVAALAATAFADLPAHAAGPAPEPHVAPAASLAGALELSLDRQAVAELIKAGIPGPIPVAIPGVGGATVVLEAPDTVAFNGGGLEAQIGVLVRELGFRGRISLRYVPHIDEEQGLVQLKPVRAKADGALAVLPDLAPMLPPVSVPRGFDRVLHPQGGVPTMVSVRVHGVEITDDRLVVKLGLSTRRRAEKPAPRDPSVPGT